jgi:hypothetical protein
MTGVEHGVDNNSCILVGFRLRVYYNVTAQIKGFIVLIYGKKMSVEAYAYTYIFSLAFPG